MKNIFKLLCFVSLYAFLLIPASSIVAQTISPIFNTNAISFQQGNQFEVGEKKRQILTLEHYSLWNIGDIYMFYDKIRDDKSHNLSYYGEFSPRLSLSTFGLNTKQALISDMLIATTFEKGSNGFKAFLLGPGLNWDIPAFEYFTTNFYYRDTHGIKGHTWQITSTWGLPFNIASTQWLFDGYIDIRGSEDNLSKDSMFNPQLKLDIGQLFGYEKKLYAGVEYYHWNNKFGIKGVNERLFAPLIQFRFSF